MLHVLRAYVAFSVIFCQYRTSGVLRVHARPMLSKLTTQGGSFLSSWYWPFPHCPLTQGRQLCMGYFMASFELKPENLLYFLDAFGIAGQL